MKKFLIAALLLTGLSLWVGDVSGHGGTYRGPGDTVPPGAGGGGGGAAPTGPSGPPTTGGPSGAPAGGPVITGAPAQAPGGSTAGPETTGGDLDVGADLDLWSFWWEFNKDRFLNLRSRLHSDEVTTGSAEWWLGEGQREQGRDTLRVTDADRYDKIVPALKAALAGETNNDIVTACLIALAKIGDRRTESPADRSEFQAIIEPFLASSNLEIRETAAVSLGILGNPSSVQALIDLTLDTPAGRRMVGSSEVDRRTRSFAAYGLGLIGARQETSQAARLQIVHALQQNVAAAERDASPDRPVAMVISLGLAGLDPRPDGQQPGERAALARDRQEQIDFLLDFLDKSTNNYVRAHIPTAIVRLLDGLPAGDREKYTAAIANNLIQTLARSRQAEGNMSAAQTLGLLGTSGMSQLDRNIRTALLTAYRNSAHNQVKNFALISLGMIGGTPGADGSFDGRREIEQQLQQALARGSGHTPHWAALAVGVMGRMLNDIDQTIPTGLATALGDRLARATSPNDVGAFSVSAGILGEVDHRQSLRTLLQRTAQDEPRGYVALALGLQNSMEDREAIAKIVRESEYRPELLKQAAIALGLLGDREIVPELLDMLREARVLATQASLASALGFIGDRRSVDDLIAMLNNRSITPIGRAFAAVALGIVADKEDLPWNAKIAENLNYRATTATLNDQNGTGILNIL